MFVSGCGGICVLFVCVCNACEMFMFDDWFMHYFLLQYLCIFWAFMFYVQINVNISYNHNHVPLPIYM